MAPHATQHINGVLKHATIDNAKPKDKRYDLTDGGGQTQEVMPLRAKTWRFKYYLNCKREKLTVGAYPASNWRRAARTAPLESSSTSDKAT